MSEPGAERSTLTVDVAPADIDELDHVSNLVYALGSAFTDPRS